MIYIVTGQGSGGTSGAMRVLIEGGIAGNFHNNNNTEMLSILRNPYGCFEQMDINKMEDHCQKIMGVVRMKALGIKKAKVILMKRKGIDVVTGEISPKYRRIISVNDILKFGK